MQHQLNQTTAVASPTTEDVLRIWRTDGCLRDSSAAVYLQWIRRFYAYSVRYGIDDHAELTQEGADRFIAWYAAQRRLDPRRLGGARTALRALSRVYQAMGHPTPPWKIPRSAPPAASQLINDYANHLVHTRGNPAPTVHKKLKHIEKLLEYLAGRDKTWRTLALTDIDEFLVDCTSDLRVRPWRIWPAASGPLPAFCCQPALFQSNWPHR